jgi:acid phosphatase (class A)
MLKLQSQRTPADEKRCQDEVAVTAFGFSNVLGPWFNADDLPYTAQLMHEIGQQAKAVSGGGKKIWSRVRPPLSDTRIHPCVPLEKTFSYPSGHATIGAFWGALLADMFPADHDMLIARGRQIGFDRTVAGMHWPSDIVAGQKLGAEAARRLLADPAFREKLKKAKAECMDAMKRQATTQPHVTRGPSHPSPQPAAPVALQLQPAGR